MDYPNSGRIFERNRRFIPGGVSSTNRLVKPEIAFTQAQGAYLWDAEGNRYIDYHAAFAPHLLGHNDPYVNEAVMACIKRQESLYGAGATAAEGRLAELICQGVPCVERVVFLNSGSEASSQAIRLARAVTRRSHVIVMQGGYNGWHNDVSCNVMTPIELLGPRRSPGEYPYVSLSAGVPEPHQALVHPVNFNDLDSVDYVARRFPVAALITEPVLQNIGVVKPKPGYLEGLRALANRHGFLLIFDEVKTGFRHALGGYASLCGVHPDLLIYGKAIANGYPLAALGGRSEWMDYFMHPDPGRRVFLAGTYNAHPVSTAAAIATIERLMEGGGQIYQRLDALGARIEEGMSGLLKQAGIRGVVSRQGSAFSIYFMDHEPLDWHDVAAHHDFAFDEALRRALIERGVYVFPQATKQWSISASHTEADIEATLDAFKQALDGARFSPDPASSGSSKT